MSEITPNSYGLFDTPVRSPEKERVALTQADIERQLDAGAFLMSREEAVAAGFLNPYDEQDTVIAPGLGAGAVAFCRDGCVSAFFLCRSICSCYTYYRGKLIQITIRAGAPNGNQGAAAMGLGGNAQASRTGKDGPVVLAGLWCRFFYWREGK